MSACAEDSSSRRAWMSFSRYFFSDWTESKTFSLSSASLVLWSHFVCSSCNSHCAWSSSSSALLTFPRSSFNSSSRRHFAASRPEFWATILSNFFSIVSSWLFDIFKSSLDFINWLLSSPTSLSESSHRAIKTFSLSDKMSKVFCCWLFVAFKSSNWSCKLRSFSMLFWRFSSAFVRFSFIVNKSESSSESSGSSSSIKALWSGVEFTTSIIVFSWADCSSTFNLLSSSLFRSSSFCKEAL